MSHVKNKISGVILAGGQSRRMGRDKALLQVGSLSIIEKIIQVLTKITDEIIIIANSPEKYVGYSDQVYPDLIPGCGPLGGIYTGLYYAMYSHALVVACDTPFINEQLSYMMIDAAMDYDAVIPCYNGYLEPLFALYSKTCSKEIYARLQAGLYKTQGFYDLINMRILKESEMAAVEPCLAKVFFNVNTPEDLEKARLLDKGGNTAALIISPDVCTNGI